MTKTTNTTKANTTKANANKATKAPKLTKKSLQDKSTADLVTLYNGSTDLEKPFIKSVLDELVKEQNKATTTAFAKKASKGTIMEFVSNQFVTLVRVSEDKEGNISLGDKKARVNLFTVDNAIDKNSTQKSICDNEHYKTLVALFAQNLYIMQGVELSEGEKHPCKITTLKYGKDAEGNRRVYKFEGHSRNALYQQLDAIYRFILGDDTKIHPTKASLNFIIAGSLRIVNNENGKAKMNKDRAIMNLIMNTMATRAEQKGFTIIPAQIEKQEKKTKDEIKEKRAENRSEKAIAKRQPSVTDPMTGKLSEPCDKESIKSARKSATIDNATKADEKTA